MNTITVDQVLHEGPKRAAERINTLRGIVCRSARARSELSGELRRAKEEADALRVELKHAKVGEEISDRVLAWTRAALGVPDGTSIVEHAANSAAELQRLRAENEAMKKNASGNAVLVRADGFSKPMTQFCPENPVVRYICPEFVGEILGVKHWRDRAFERTGDRDGFGRAIYKEVSK